MTYRLNFLRCLTVWQFIYVTRLSFYYTGTYPMPLFPWYLGLFELLMRNLGSLILPIYFGKVGLYPVEVLA